MSNFTSRITFYGGTGIVTGANFLFETDPNGERKGQGLRILVDCGFVQGGASAHSLNKKAFDYDPASIDILFVTHAHLDHIGKIPKLVQDGFKGKIISTPETKEITTVMLADSANLLRREANNHEQPIYTENDVATALSLWSTIPYHTDTEVGDGFIVHMRDAGHILGSSMITFVRDGKNIVFTGDLGNSPSPILRDTEVVSDANYFVMESVYGDRNHEPKDERHNHFVEVVKETIAAHGTLVIPAFSLERTQIVLYQLNEMIENKVISAIPVFLDSPLAIKVTKIYQELALRDFNETVRKDIKLGDDVFKFPNLKFTVTTDESKAIEHVPAPKIIIAGSGMSNGGRVIHHEKKYLPDSKSTVLMLGYEAVGTLGRTLQDGAKIVTIEGEQVPVRARIVNIQGYSSHKDSENLVEFVSYSAQTLKEVFCVMGEPKSSLFLVQRLRDYLGVNASMPKLGESRDIQV